MLAEERSCGGAPLDERGSKLVHVGTPPNHWNSVLISAEPIGRLVRVVG